MAIKKNAHYSSLWASCDELCGGMDASRYKDYVLTLLFVKYVSDKAKGNPYAMIEVPKGASFTDETGPKGLTIYEQAVDNASCALARRNMIMHDYPTSKVWKGKTLAALEQKLAKTCDLKRRTMQQLLTGRIRLPLAKEA